MPTMDIIFGAAHSGETKKHSSVLPSEISGASVEAPERAESVTEKDKWENGEYVVRIESLRDGDMRVRYLTESKKIDREGEQQIFADQNELETFLRNNGFNLKSRRYGHRPLAENVGNAAPAVSTEPAADGDGRVSVADPANVVYLKETYRHQPVEKTAVEESPQGTENTETATEGENVSRAAEQLANRVSDLIESARITAKMRHENGWLTEEEEIKWNGTLDASEIRLYEVVRRFNEGIADEESTIKELRELEVGLDIDRVRSATPRKSKEKKVKGKTERRPKKGGSREDAQETVITSSPAADTKDTSPVSTEKVSAAGEVSSEMEEISGKPKTLRKRAKRQKAKETPVGSSEAVVSSVIPGEISEPAAVPTEGEIDKERLREEQMARVQTVRDEEETGEEKYREDTGASRSDGKREVVSEATEEHPQEKSERETLYQKIARLTEEADELRAAYVKEDFEQTTVSKKLKSFFRLREDAVAPEGSWRKLYEEKIAELQQAEIETMGSDTEGRTLSADDTKEGMARLLRYYKIDEAVNVINARTQYRAEGQGFFKKMGDTFGALGRNYNRLSFKEKMLLTGLLTSGAIVSTMSGGFAGGALAGLFIVSKRVMGGAAAFAGTEALLEKQGEKNRTANAEREITNQMGTLAEGDEAFSRFKEMLARDIYSLDEKLQREKRAKTYRKGAAILAGVAAGSSSWLLNNTVAEEGIREHMQTLAGTSPETGALGTATVITEATKEAGATGKFQDILSGPYEVRKGDSVWKILSARAEGLEGAQKTHFIDALKDKVGDVRLKAGASFDFSKHLTQEDIGKAYAEAKELSADKIASIAANDVKIAEFAKAHPEVTLTDKTVGAVLEGKTGGATDLGTQAATEASVPLEAFGTATESIPAETVTTADMRSSDPREFLRDYPDQAPAFRKELGNFRMQIFRTPEVEHLPSHDYLLRGEELGRTKVVQATTDYHHGVFQDSRLNPLHQSQMKNLNDFVGRAEKDFGSVGYAKADETIEAYTRRIATLVSRKKMDSPDYLFRF